MLGMRVELPVDPIPACQPGDIEREIDIAVQDAVLRSAFSNQQIGEAQQRRGRAVEQVEGYIRTGCAPAEAEVMPSPGVGQRVLKGKCIARLDRVFAGADRLLRDGDVGIRSALRNHGRPDFRPRKR